MPKSFHYRQTIGHLYNVKTPSSAGMFWFTTWLDAKRQYFITNWLEKGKDSIVKTIEVG